MLKVFMQKWKNRKKYKTYDEMPSWILSFNAVTGFIVSSYYTYALSKIMPDYLEVANKIPLDQWGLQGWTLTTILAAVGFMVWHFGSVAWRCQGILRERWYK